MHPGKQQGDHGVHRQQSVHRQATTTRKRACDHVTSPSFTHSASSLCFAVVRLAVHGRDRALCTTMWCAVWRGPSIYAVLLPRHRVHIRHICRLLLDVALPVDAHEALGAHPIRQVLGHLSAAKVSQRRAAGACVSDGTNQLVFKARDKCASACFCAQQNTVFQSVRTTAGAATRCRTNTFRRRL